MLTTPSRAVTAGWAWAPDPRGWTRRLAAETPEPPPCYFTTHQRTVIPLQSTPSILPIKKPLPLKIMASWAFWAPAEHSPCLALQYAIPNSDISICLASLCVRHTKLDLTTKGKCLVCCRFWNRYEETFGSWTQGCSSYELLVKHRTSSHSLVGTNAALTWISDPTNSIALSSLASSSSYYFYLR